MRRQPPRAGAICKTCGKPPSFCFCKRKPHAQQRVVKVRQRIMLRTYSKVVNSIAHLNDEERRRVMRAANITCGEAP